MRVLTGEQVLVRVFLGESDKWHHRNLAAALLERLRQEHFAGATVFHCVAGFGAHSLIHTTRILRLSEDLPMVIEIVDSEHRMERLTEILYRAWGVEESNPAATCAAVTCLRLLTAAIPWRQAVLRWLRSTQRAWGESPSREVRSSAECAREVCRRPSAGTVGTMSPSLSVACWRFSPVSTRRSPGVWAIRSAPVSFDLCQLRPGCCDFPFDGTGRLLERRAVHTLVSLARWDDRRGLRREHAVASADLVWRTQESVDRQPARRKRPGLIVSLGGPGQSDGRSRWQSAAAPTMGPRRATARPSAADRCPKKARRRRRSKASRTRRGRPHARFARAR